MSNVIAFRRKREPVNPLVIMSLKLLTDLFEAHHAAPSNDIAAARAMIDNAEKRGV